MNDHNLYRPESTESSLSACGCGQHRSPMAAIASVLPLASMQAMAMEKQGPLAQVDCAA